MSVFSGFCFLFDVLIFSSVTSVFADVLKA